MNTIKSILNKKVISLYDGTIEGYVQNIICDKYYKKIKYFVVIKTTENNISTKLVLPTKNIYNIGQDAIIISNNSYLENIQNIEPYYNEYNFFGNNIYSVLGDKKGNLEDINIDEKYNIISYKIDNGEVLYPQNIAKFANQLILIYDNGKKININSFKTKKINITKTKEKIQIMNIESEHKIDNTNDTTIILPTKITSSVDFLLGRVMTKNLYSHSQELIAKKGNTISLTTIENAKRNGKIKELAFFSA